MSRLKPPTPPPPLSPQTPPSCTNALWVAAATAFAPALVLRGKRKEKGKKKKGGVVIKSGQWGGDSEGRCNSSRLLLASPIPRHYIFISALASGRAWP